MVSIEDVEVINSLILEGYQAALIKGDELVVFDKNTITRGDESILKSLISNLK